jgi:16S rRNA (guanine527-N7)-methyltransferase
MTPDAWSAAQLERMDVSRETLHRLEAFAALLLRWNPRINLISPASLRGLWARHIVDSAQVFCAARLQQGTWLDLGTGGGFPGLVCAILSEGFATPIEVTCVESDRRKAAFLSTAAQNLGLKVKVLAKRIEDIPLQNADIVTARALAPLKKLLDLTQPHLRLHGHAVFPKGAAAEAEIAAARSSWSFSLEPIPSITDLSATLLRIGDLQRV